MAVVVQAYLFALDPSPAQERMLRSHAGAARFAWNWGLARCKERYEAERRWYSGAELHKLWNAEKKADPGLAWWPENSKCAYQEAFRDLDRALNGFVKSRRGERKGKRLGFPKFKKRGKCRDSFRFGTGPIRCGRRSVTLPRLSEVAIHESGRKLARRLENGSARILSATAAGITAQATPGVPRALPQAAGLSELAQVGRPPGPHPRAGRERPGGRAAQSHLGPGRPVRDVGYGRPERGRATRNRRLARALSDQGFGLARRMLSYKSTWNGGQVILAAGSTLVPRPVPDAGQ